MNTTRRRRHASLRAQAVALLITALVAFGVLAVLHVRQGDARTAAQRTLTELRNARLDVAVGFAHLLGADLDDSPFDRAQGRALVEQGLDHLDAPSLPITPDEAAELAAESAGVRSALSEQTIVGGDGASTVALRVAVGRLEAVAGRVDVDAEVELRRSIRRQEDLFTLALAASSLLLGLVFVLLRRTSRNAEAAEAARGQAETARDEAETASRASQASEREASELLQAVADGATDAIFVKDVEGRYRFINASAARVLGRRADDVLGCGDATLWDDESAQTILEHDALVLRSGEPSSREEELLVGNDLRVFSTTKVPRLTPDGRVIGLIGISRDVTERVRIEAQARQAQKMESIGRLAGGIAHDFNNLLTVINGYADILQDPEPTDAEDARAMVAEIHDAGRRASGLTAQLLAFSRRALVAPQRFDLNAAVEHSERLFRRLIGEDVILTTALTESPCIIEMDPSALDQVLMNLCVNARDAMPRGGTLKMSTGVVSIDAGPRAGRWAELCVVDSGEGMPPEVRARIFEPFFTTKGVGKGTGLGLSVIDGAVAQAGGHIVVESEVGRGATFRVRLPLAADGDAQVSTSTSGGVALQGQETLLLVEDDDSVRALARRCLEANGYRVVDAAAGDLAITAAAAYEGHIDLLLTDVVMPRMSGRELVDRLRSERPTIRVLYMTGYTDDAIIRHGVGSGGDPILAKPFTATSMARKVRDVLDAPAPGAST